jgi:ferrochelatase
MNLDVVATSSRVGYGGAPFGVLLLHVGGPARLDEVRAYLDQRWRHREALSVGFILRAPFLRALDGMRTRRLQRKLRSLPTPPAFRETLLQCATGVEKRLRLHGRDATVRGVCRFLDPRIEPALVELHAQGLRRLILVFLHAQTSSLTTASLWHDYRLAASQSACAFRVNAVESWYADAAYLDLMAETLQSALAAIDAEELADVRVLFCADGIPEAPIPEDDRYLEQVDATIQGIIARLPSAVRWGVGFHAGSSLQRWMSPGIEAATQELAESGGRHLICMPMAVQEQLEPLYEIDVRLVSAAARMGFETMQRVPAVAAHPAFLDLLTGLIENKLTAE